MGGWNAITADLASAGKGGWRMHRTNAGAALLLGTAYILDAAVEDAIVTLPPCSENAGRLFFAERIDTTGTLFLAELVVDSSLDTIEGAGSYSLASQWSSVLLLATNLDTFFVVSEK